METFFCHFRRTLLASPARAAGVLLAVLFLAFPPGVSPAPQEQETFVVYYGCSGQWEVATPLTAREKSAAKTTIVSAAGITWNLTYLDAANTGWNDTTRGPRRKQVLQAVLLNLSAMLDHPGGRCDVELRVSEFDGSGVLASGGTLYRTSASAPNGYQPGLAFQNITTAVDIAPTLPDIRLRVDWGWRWHEEFSAPPDDVQDLYSVLLHEMAHALGYNSLAESNGSSKFEVGSGKKIFTTYDNLLFERATGRKLWDANLNFQGSNLAGGANFIELRSQRAHNVYPGRTFPPVHTPTTFSDGRSLSHWQTAETPLEAIMRFTTPGGELRRGFSPFERAVLEELGYRLKPDPTFWMMY